MEKTNLITIYVYNKKQLAQTQSMGGVISALLTKKMKLVLQTAFHPSQIHDSTDYYSQIPTIAVLLFTLHNDYTWWTAEKRVQRRSAHPGRYDISLPTRTKSTTDNNTVLV